jgi:uncharacterized protein YdeI (YjbR/CyaY-like superfamily)
MTPTHFETPAAFRAWLERHHDTEKELWVGFFKVKSGRGGMVYQQALDEALCFGWIDGMVRRVDEDRYAQRFTPRKARSTWSQVNVRRAQELIAEGRMRPPGLAAFERRPAAAPAYSFEQRSAAFTPAQLKRLKANASAWAYFNSQPPSYQRLATWWVISAKREDTRDRRLATLIEDSAAGRRRGVATPGK